MQKLQFQQSLCLTLPVGIILPHRKITFREQFLDNCLFQHNSTAQFNGATNSLTFTSQRSVIFDGMGSVDIINIIQLTI